MFTPGGKTLTDIEDSKILLEAVGGHIPGISASIVPLKKFARQRLRDKYRKLPFQDVITDEGRNELKSILISAGFDLFQSLEFQFMHVEPKEQNNKETAIYKLAEDATQKSINYFIQEEESNFEASKVLEGVLNEKKGFESKHTLFFCVPGANKLQIKTKHFFEDPIPALTRTIDGQEYIDQSICQTKLGYRRLLEHESGSTSSFPMNEQKRYKYQVTQDDFSEEFKNKVLMSLLPDDVRKLEKQKKSTCK